MKNVILFEILFLPKKKIAIVVIFGLLLVNFVFAEEIPLSDGQVYVCPLAEKMEKINPRCTCRIDLILGEKVISECPQNGQKYEMFLTIRNYEGKDYYAIYGFENGGAAINLPPLANTKGPYEGFVEKEILFDGSSSSDPNDDPLDYFWDFGDGTLGEGKNVYHIYTKPGNYLVYLSVFDGLSSSTITTSVNILKNTYQEKDFFSFLKREKIEKETKRENNFQPEREKTENAKNTSFPFQKQIMGETTHQPEKNFTVSILKAADDILQEKTFIYLFVVPILFVSIFQLKRFFSSGKK